MHVHTKFPVKAINKTFIWRHILKFKNLFYSRVSSCETVLQLYKKNHQLLEIMKDKPAPGGSTGNKKKVTITGKPVGSGGALGKQGSLVSFQFIHSIITALFGYVYTSECLQNPNRS